MKIKRQCETEEECDEQFARAYEKGYQLGERWSRARPLTWQAAIILGMVDALWDDLLPPGQAPLEFDALMEVMRKIFGRDHFLDIVRGARKARKPRATAQKEWDEIYARYGPEAAGESGQKNLPDMMAAIDAEQDDEGEQ